MFHYSYTTCLNFRGEYMEITEPATISLICLIIFSTLQAVCLSLLLLGRIRASKLLLTICAVWVLVYSLAAVVGLSIQCADLSRAKNRPIEPPKLVLTLPWLNNGQSFPTLPPLPTLPNLLTLPPLPTLKPIVVLPTLPAPGGIILPPVPVPENVITFASNSIEIFLGLLYFVIAFKTVTGVYSFTVLMLSIRALRKKNSRDTFFEMSNR